MTHTEQIISDYKIKLEETKQDIARHTLILNQLKLRHQEILNKLDRYIEEHTKN